MGSDRTEGEIGCCLFQAEDGIRDLVRSRGLGDVYKRQVVEGCRRPAIMVGGGRAVAADVRLAPRADIAVLLSLIHI